MNTIRIFLIEKQPQITQNHMNWLNRMENIKFMGSAQNGEDALLRINQLREKPQVVLCDLSLSGISGIEVTRTLKVLDNSIEVIIFATQENEQQLLDAIYAGASGYLLKNIPREKLQEIIIDISRGGSVIQPRLAKHLLKYLAHPQKMPEAQYQHKTSLTLRELECLQMVAKGLSNGETAQVLSLSRATIRTHLEHIYQKLDVTNRVEAVTEGIRQGIIDL